MPQEKTTRQYRARVLPQEKALPDNFGERPLKKETPVSERTRVRRGPLNYGLGLVFALLICIGVLMVFSSTYVEMIIKNKQATAEFLEQAVGGAACLLLIFIVSRIDYRILYSRFFVGLVLAACAVMLGAVFLFPAVNGAQRWIKIFGISLQPSEFTKFGLVLFISYYCAHNREWPRKLKTWLLPWGIILPAVLLVVAEPNLSTALVCLLLPSILLLFVAGLQKFFFFSGLATAGVGGLAMIFFTDWRAGRFGAWLNPWADPDKTGYQVLQSLYALADGGLFGVGLGNSRQKITHLPMADTDYIFSIIGEEFGLVGAGIVLALFVLLILYGVRTSMNAPDLFGGYLAAGITVVIGLQAFVNVAVVTNTIPSTGVTLPFVSRGLSSLLAFSLAAGLLLSISSYSQRRAPPKEKSLERSGRKGRG